MESSSVCSSLWPVGDDKRLLYAMANYYQQILQNHGTKLMSEQLIKLSKLRDITKTLVLTLNGDDTIPSVAFNLPGIYYLWLNQTTSSDTIGELPCNSTSFPGDKYRHNRATSMVNINKKSNKNHKITLPKPNNTQLRNTQNAKFDQFDAFIAKLKQENSENTVKESSPQYRTFLEQARLKYNSQSQSDECVIESINDVPSLKTILHEIRDDIESQKEQKSDDIDDSLSLSLCSNSSQEFVFIDSNTKNDTNANVKKRYSLKAKAKIKKPPPQSKLSQIPKPKRKTHKRAATTGHRMAAPPPPKKDSITTPPPPPPNLYKRSNILDFVETETITHEMMDIKSEYLKEIGKYGKDIKPHMFHQRSRSMIVGPLKPREDQLMMELRTKLLKRASVDNDSKENEQNNENTGSTHPPLPKRSVRSLSELVKKRQSRPLPALPVMIETDEKETINSE